MRDFELAPPSPSRNPSVRIGVGGEEGHNFTMRAGANIAPLAPLPEPEFDAVRHQVVDMHDADSPPGALFHAYIPAFPLSV